MVVPAITLFLALLAPQATTPATTPPATQPPAAQPAPQTPDVPAPPSKQIDWAHMPCAADASGVYRGSIGLHEPVLIYMAPLESTKDAERMKIQGYTLVNITVDEMGKPQHVHVVRSITTMVPESLRAAALPLDQKAVDAVNKYRFRPATCNGKPVPTLLDIQLQFRLPTLPVPATTSPQTPHSSTP
jgi:TonB family protein